MPSKKAAPNFIRIAPDPSLPACDRRFQAMEITPLRLGFLVVPVLGRRPCSDLTRGVGWLPIGGGQCARCPASFHSFGGCCSPRAWFVLHPLQRAKARRHPLAAPVT